MINTITRRPNGLKVVHKKMDGVRSVAICVMTRVGSVNENDSNNGISHLIEHMMFKGTAKRSSFDIVKDIASLGAQVNAFTSKEATCYYIVTVDEYVDECMEILSDLYFNSVFDKDELQREKSVVLEEIAMSNDTPDDLCLENLNSLYYKGHTLGYTILGSSDNIDRLTRDDIKAYIADKYCADNTVVTLVGNIEQDEAVRLADKYFTSNFSNKQSCDTVASVEQYNSGSVIVAKDLEQSNIAFNLPGFAYGHRLDMATAVLNTVLGSGMSSRLFQEVREKLGLAYSVYSYPSAYTMGGDLAIYLGTNVRNGCKAIEVVRKELDKIKKDGLTADELELGKRQMKGGYVLSQESSSSLMRVMSRTALLLDRPFDFDERLAKIDSVTMDDIREVLDYMLDYDRLATSYVGQAIDYDPIEVFRG